MSHLIEALTRYKENLSPGYAVLVTGPWGVGKTFQVKDCLEENDYIYVSLHGTQTVEQINAEVFAAAHPVTDWIKKTTTSAEDAKIGAFGVSLPVGKFWSAIAGAFVKGEINSDKILIFDDLERCGLPIQDILGAINFYVEHKNCRVIIIAHDKSFTIEEEFDKTKEKTIGSVVRVTPQFDIVLDKFISLIKNIEHKTFIIDCKIHIKEIFLKSKTENLRVIQRSIEDIIRLYDVLDERYISDKGAMGDLIKEFLAFQIEFRTGKLAEEDLGNRSRKLNEYYFEKLQRRKNNDVDDNHKDRHENIVNFYSKYHELHPDRSFLSGDVLIDILSNGVFDENQIRRSVNMSSKFSHLREMEDWEILISYQDHEDKDVLSALDRINENFENRKFSKLPILKHIFCIRIEMARNGIIRKDVSKVFRENKDYINDMLSKGALSPLREGRSEGESYPEEYGGYGYWYDSETEQYFRQICDHIKKMRDKAFSENERDSAVSLLKEIENNAMSFAEKITYYYGRKGDYFDYPILAKIPENTFVDTWLKACASNRNIVRHSLEKRYQNGELEDSLRAEKMWIENVMKELDRRASVETGLAAMRIKCLRPEL